jgi:hypothetical protein
MNSVQIIKQSRGCLAKNAATSNAAAFLGPKTGTRAICMIWDIPAKEAYKEYSGRRRHLSKAQ